MRQLISIHQQIDHKIRIEGSSMSQELKPVCTKSAGEPNKIAKLIADNQTRQTCTKSAEEPILDAHFHRSQRTEPATGRTSWDESCIRRRGPRWMFGRSNGVVEWPLFDPPSIDYESQA